MFFAVGITGVAGLWAFVVMLRQLYFICQPSEVLIFAGLSRTTGDGREANCSDLLGRHSKNRLRAASGIYLSYLTGHLALVPLAGTVARRVSDKDASGKVND